MAFKVFTSAVLTAADVNDYLQEQAVIVCTSGTRPTAQEGMTIYETDTDRVQVYDGTGWIKLYEPAQSWTPTVTNLTTTSGTWTAGYTRSGGWLDYWGKFVFGASSAIAGALTLTLPVNASVAILGQHFVRVVDSGTAQYEGTGRNASTSAVDLQVLDASVTNLRATPISSTVPMTWTTSDELHISGRYRLTTLYS